MLALAFGVHYRVATVIEKTGLNPAMPPPTVHAMSHRSTDAGGAYYYADLFDAAIRAAGFDLEPGMKGLDFGCSSARLVRILQLVFPHTEWYGCDPNVGAIDWATAHLPGIHFFVSPTEPPLPLADGFLDVVVAISIWSHFSEQAALRWFDEMERLIRPGGILVLTVQGWTSVQLLAERKLWGREQLQVTIDDLYSRGISYVEVFGPGGDHGVASPDWGMTHLSPEWLTAHLCPPWSVLDFEPGRVEDHQDLVVLRRGK